jgi:two-component system, OmpR family, response regulator
MAASRHTLLAMTQGEDNSHSEGRMQNKIKLLVVDDDVRLSTVLSRLLTMTGRFSVEVVNNPLDACATAVRLQPDLIILDVIMPFKDGGTVASEIRQEPSLAQVPVVFLTSIIDHQEAAARGNTLGNDPVLAKPITIQNLVAQIDALLP